MDTIWTIMNAIVVGFEYLVIAMLGLFTFVQAKNGRVPKAIRMLYDAIFVLYNEEDL